MTDVDGDLEVLQAYVRAHGHEYTTATWAEALGRSDQQAASIVRRLGSEPKPAAVGWDARKASVKAEQAEGVRRICADLAALLPSGLDCLPTLRIRAFRGNARSVLDEEPEILQSALTWARLPWGSQGSRGPEVGV